MPGEIRVAIVGSQNYFPTALAYDYVKKLVAEHPEVQIVSGGAPGVDTVAESAANSFASQPPKIFRPDYSIPGPSKYHIRNDLILAYADWIVAFWDRQSPGTKSVCKKAVRQGKLALCFDERGKILYKSMKEFPSFLVPERILSLPGKTVTG